MVTPDRRRRAVVVLVARFGVSERRACRVVGQHRSTQRRAARPMPAADEKLRRWLREFARRHPRLGWRKAHDVVRREGWVVNHKKLRRLWREEGLRRPATTQEQETSARQHRRLPAAGRTPEPCVGVGLPVRRDR